MSNENNFTSNCIEILSSQNDDIYDSKHLLGCRALWRAVIMQAITDIINNYSRTEDKIEKEFARQWILDGREDFLTVCSMAEYNSYYIQRKVKSIIKNNTKYNHNTLNVMKRKIDNKGINNINK